MLYQSAPIALPEKPSMKLYTFDPAPNPMRVNLFIACKGIEIDTEQVDLGTLKQFEDDFLKINPQAAVPVLLLDDGTVLTEIISICDYLESVYPDKPLMGKTALERAQVLNWDHRIHVEFLLAIAEALRNTAKSFANRAVPGQTPIAQIPELAERGGKRVDAILKELETYLGSHRYFVGDSITLADIDAYCCFEFCGWIKKPIPEEHTNTHAWLGRFRAELGL